MRLVIYLILPLLFFAQNISSQTAEEQEMLDLVNDLRQSRGLNLLRLNTALNQAAFDHSSDMAINDYFSHTGLDGSNFSQRSIDAGYTGSPRGENIAAGNSGVEATFNQWKNSTGHLNNMLNNNINEMGIGHAYDSHSTYRHYWTQIFGRGDATLSNDDIAHVEGLEVFPNPAQDKINIRLKNSLRAELDFRVISLSGKIIYENSTELTNNVASIDIQNLAIGIYFVYIKNIATAYKIIKI